MITDTSDTALHLKGVRFGYTSKELTLDIPELTLARGQRAFLQGPSGSGKSTLLSLIAGVMPPQQGQVTVLGEDLGAMTNEGRDAFRADRLGVIFQLFNLLPYMSMVDNVLLPCRFSRTRAARAQAGGKSLRAAAIEMLERLGLGELIGARRGVSALSVGQQQRVAAARALIGAPELIIADEPTSALDTDNRQAFIDTLLSEVARTEATLLFVSHDTELGTAFDTQLSLPELNKANQGVSV